MSDYMFMLESHVSPEQTRAVNTVEAAAEEAGINAFLTGGALRDMLGGFPIRDLDFTVEGDPAKAVKVLEKKYGVKSAPADGIRKAFDLVFPSGVSAEIAMAFDARYAKPGDKPRIKPSSIHEDLRRRDFTVNSIAISLNKGSRGLLLDPTNGLGDLERRELRANSNYTLYDDPSRILRMFRLRARLGFELAEKTQNQYAGVREARLELKIPPAAVREELHRIADELNPGEIIETLDREKLLGLFSPASSGSKLNIAGFSKLLKAKQSVPFGVEFPIRNFGLFFHTLTEKLSDRERKLLIKKCRLSKRDAAAPAELEKRAKKLERALQSAKLKRASLVFELLRSTPGEDILFMAMHSGKRIVHDRIKNYLTKYLEVANDVTDKDLAYLNLDPSSPKFQQAKLDRIHALLDGRIRKPAPPPEPPPPPPQPASVWARR
jgi:tRNA nucleotidyltransferase/poly(A) polymerase